MIRRANPEDNHNPHCYTSLLLKMARKGIEKAERKGFMNVGESLKYASFLFGVGCYFEASQSWDADVQPDERMRMSLDELLERFNALEIRDMGQHPPDPLVVGLKAYLERKAAA